MKANEEIQNIVEESEKILWEGRPIFFPYVLSANPYGSIFSAPNCILLFFATALFSIGYFVTPITPDHMSPIPFYVFAAFAIFLQIIVLVYNAILYTRIHYAVTNKRVIIQGGIIGRDFDAVDFDKIVQVQVKVGLIDIISGLFGKKTGSIFVHTPIASTMLTASQGLIPTFHILAHVADPYSVFRFVKKVSYDVKTDIEYPNALRPKKNPGYMTEYNPSAEEFS